MQTDTGDKTKGIAAAVQDVGAGKHIFSVTRVDVNKRSNSHYYIGKEQRTSDRLALLLLQLARAPSD